MRSPETAMPSLSMRRSEVNSMDIYELSEFKRIRTVYYERHEQGGFTREYESRTIELCERGSDHYLLYWYDPLPGGYGDNRCEGIVHITEGEAKKDDRQLANLYFDTRVKPLISMSLNQKEMTLDFLSAAYCADRICFAYCASALRQKRSAGCIEVSRDAMNYMSEQKLAFVLKKILPAGTVIPEIILSKKRKRRHQG